ncbi:MAG: hypothetical protein ACYTDT_09650 [Planctomycetota bacterium]|jgi:hypothetical protein
MQLVSRWPDQDQSFKFMVLNEADLSSRANPELSIRALNQNRDDLLDALENVSRLGIQYAPYGLHKTGQPKWLTDALNDWKTSDKCLAVMFHEVYAKSSVWQRSFWNATGQKECMQAIGALSDEIFTTTSKFQSDLKEIGINSRVVPTPSNIPQLEPEYRADENMQVVVFGLPASRANALKAHKAVLQKLVEANRLEKLTLMGPDTDKDVVAGVPGDLVSRKGFLASEEVAMVFVESDLMLCAHDSSEIQKSGSAMAAIANGCAALVRVAPSDSSERAFPFWDMEDMPPAIYYWDTNLPDLNRAQVNDIAKDAQNWSQVYDHWRNTVDAWSSALNDRNRS